jgi:hypothetical protein
MVSTQIGALGGDRRCWRHFGLCALRDRGQRRSHQRQNEPENHDPDIPVGSLSKSSPDSAVRRIPERIGDREVLYIAYFKGFPCPISRRLSK